MANCGEKVLARPISTDPVNRPRIPETHSKCDLERDTTVQRTSLERRRARDVRRLEPQSRWDKEAVNSVIGVRWMLTTDHKFK